jgi:hypothetical protein
MRQLSCQIKNIYQSAIIFAALVAGLFFSAKAPEVCFAEACSPGAISGCAICNSTGSLWVDLNSRCPSGKVCSAGTCVVVQACTPGSISGCKVCDPKGIFWINENSKCPSGQSCSYGECIKKKQNLLILETAPSGEIYDSNVVLSVLTNELSDCRFSGFDQVFDVMASAFVSSDGLHHTAKLLLMHGGDYSYYIQCRGRTGNVDPVSAKIIFSYISRGSAQSPAASSAGDGVADNEPPIILNPAPSGNLPVAAAALSCTTNEKATCRYDTADAGYDSMHGVMDDSNGGIDHNKIVSLPNPGAYTYYIRCKDASGNVDINSAKIYFNFTPRMVAGPVISNVSPSGTVYQKIVSLIVSASVPSECRYSTTDKDFDLMKDDFITKDGLQQQAVVTLNGFGQYSYFVRCEGKNDNKDMVSKVISFEYQNPEKKDVANVVPAFVCSVYQMGGRNGACNNAQDCVCDPDCSAVPDPGADPDCSKVTETSQTTDKKWLSFAAVSLLAAVVVVVILKNRMNGKGVDEDGENGDNNRPEKFRSPWEI